MHFQIVPFLLLEIHKRKILNLSVYLPTYIDRYRDDDFLDKLSGLQQISTTSINVSQVSWNDNVQTYDD